MSEPRRQRFYEFDAFLLDARERLLFHEGRPLDLTPKVFDILLELVERSGQVVEKRELMERVWPEQFVEEGNLAQHVSTLRKKLAAAIAADAAPDVRRYVMTVPGRGYRFVAGVRGWDAAAVVTVRERIRTRVVREDEVERAEILESIARPEEALTEDARVEVFQSSRPTLRALAAAPRRTFARRAATLLALALIIAAVAFGLYKLFARRVAPFEHTKLFKLTTSGRVGCAALSSDGRRVAYVLVEAEGQSLWVRQTATPGAGVQVIAPSTFHYANVAFSNDGEYVYYFGADGSTPAALERVPALGGRPERLADDVDSPPAFSPDGARMAYLRGYPDQKETALMIADARGGGERKLASLKEPGEKFILFSRLSWSPDGKRIVCAVAKVDDAGERQELYEVSAEDGAVKTVTRGGWLKVGGAAWLKDGSGLLMLAADQETGLMQVWLVSYPEGTARKVTNDLDEYKDLSLSADSRTLAALKSERQANVFIHDLDSAHSEQLTDGNYDGIEGLAWGADRRVVYTSLTNGAQSLWARDVTASGGTPLQLTDGAGNERSAAVSADGRSLAYVSSRDGRRHIWITDSNGGRARRLTEGICDINPAFTPDGQWVVYRAYDFGSPNLFKVPTAGGRPVRLTDTISGPPAVSPDGRFAACTYREKAIAPTRLALVPLEGDATPRLLDLKSVPARLMFQWTTDGRALLYVDTRGGVSNIWAQPTDGGAPKQLTDFTSDLILNFAPSPDGRRLALARGRIQSDVVLIQSVE